MALYKDNFKVAKHLTTKCNFGDQYAEEQATGPTRNHHKDSRSNKQQSNLKTSNSYCVFVIIVHILDIISNTFHAEKICSLF